MQWIKFQDQVKCVNGRVALFFHSSRYIHSSTHFLYPLPPGPQGSAGAYLSCHGAIRATKKDKQTQTSFDTHTHTHLPTIYSSHFSWHACFWPVGGSWSTQREPTDTREKMQTPHEKVPRSNPCPSCCKVTVLTTKPPCGATRPQFNSF